MSMKQAFLIFPILLISELFNEVLESQKLETEAHIQSDTIVSWA